MITASKVHAARRCAYAFRPDVPKTPRESGKAAVMGTAAHAYLETIIKAGDDKHFDMMEGEAIRHARQAFKWVKSFGLPTHVELGFIYNTETDTAELGPRRGEPGYDVTPEHCIRGTFDMVWVRNGDGVVVDYKTGKVENAHLDQLHIQAVAASRIWKLHTVDVGFLFSRLTKFIPPAWTTLYANELDSEAGGFRKLLKVIPTADPTQGDHCRWCDVTPGACPVWANGSEQQGEE